MTILLILVACSAVRAAEPPPLRMSWGSHNAPPYAISKGGELAGGFLHDLGTLLARRLQTRAEFINVPRSRYEAQLRDGHIDLVCIVNPDWVAEPDAYLWTRRLFEEADVLVQRRRDTPWDEFADLSGKRIGTILGYRYQALDPLFRDGTALRDDAANLDSNLHRLALGRLDAAVDADIPVRYWLLRNAAGDDLQVAPLLVSHHPVSCAVSPQARAGAMRIRQAVDDLVEEGAVRDLIDAYLARKKR